MKKACLDHNVPVRAIGGTTIESQGDCPTIPVVV
jgi:hypothetical protein